MDFDIYFERILNYYNAPTIRELSEKINISASTISAWNQRKSITILKKKCRELGIYNEIFGDLNSKINVHTNSGQIAGTVQGKQEQKINYKEEEYIIPETILDDINILFKLAIENQKEDDLIDLIDEFIFNTKKELRKK
ncbi:hypothetical protein O8C76_05330 [Aliarcobacter butzleri]|uniref:HTH cro/C1-type domain-containing protein n=1 Tax=Aliarcobacter butzleri TaxID=28197 RepID=A0AAW7PYC3_9BACT|nr:hypothetical protein [Aliarcobacter butzleri]MDN5070450.1 hypothetical protein [Aliarcobacter butzleri]